MMKESIFKIDNYRNCFYQWDIGQKLTVLDNSVDAVNYAANGEDEAYKIPVVNGKAVVPDELLQGTDNLVVWAMVYDGSQYTKASATFGVIARQKPSDYVYTPTEYETFASKLNKNLGAENADKVLVVGEDGEIEAQELDLSLYATTEELDSAIDALDDSKLDNNLGAANAGKYLSVDSSGNVVAEELALDDYATKDELQNNFNGRKVDAIYKEYNSASKGDIIIGVTQNFIKSDDWFDYMTNTTSASASTRNILDELITQLGFILNVSSSINVKESNLLTILRKISNNMALLYDANMFYETATDGNEHYMVIKYKNGKEQFMINVVRVANQYVYLIDFKNDYDTGMVKATYNASTDSLSNIENVRGVNRKPGATYKDKVLSVNENGYYDFVSLPDTSTLATKEELADKLDNYIGVDKAGQVLLVNNEGNVDTVSNMRSAFPWVDSGAEPVDWRYFEWTNPSGVIVSPTYIGIKHGQQMNQPFFTVDNWDEIINQPAVGKATQPVWLYIKNSITSIFSSFVGIKYYADGGFPPQAVGFSNIATYATRIYNEIKALQDNNYIFTYTASNQFGEFFIAPVDEFAEFKFIIRFDVTNAYMTLCAIDSFGQSYSLYFNCLNRNPVVQRGASYPFRLSVDSSEFGSTYLKTNDKGYPVWIKEEHTPLVVTVTNNNGTYTADKTFTVLKGAVNSRQILLDLGGTLYSMTKAANNLIKFGSFEETGDYTFISIDVDNLVTVSSGAF